MVSIHHGSDGMMELSTSLHSSQEAQERREEREKRREGDRAFPFSPFHSILPPANGMVPPTTPSFRVGLSLPPLVTHSRNSFRHT
jgi:hypothetical protein